MEPLTAMVCYSWNDADAAELIHEELALRGFDVIHDRCTFPIGSRVGQNMVDAVATCDAFVAYLTPSSLYLDKPEGTPRPALDNEFIPIMRRWRQANGAAHRDPSSVPVVVALGHGIGSTREEVTQTVLRTTGEDISSLWNPIVLDQTTRHITTFEAADLANHVVSAVLAPGRRPDDDAPLELVVLTRGEGQPSGFVTVDATSFLGGHARRAGTPEDWERYFAGLGDLQAALARWSRERRLRVTISAHLTACIAVGRVFNQTAGWQLAVSGRHGDTALPLQTGPVPQVECSIDRINGSGAMSIEIDLVGANVVDLATLVIRTTGESPCARVQLIRKSAGDLLPEEISATAAYAAAMIRAYVGEYKPKVTRIFCASPAEFAVLLGNRCTSLHTDLQLYERDGEHYVPSLLIPSDVL